MTNPEFFRQNAPKKSVARVQKYARSIKSPSPNSSKGFNNSRGFNGTFVDRRNTSVTQNSTTMGGSLYDTPFLLDKDPGNKFKVINDVERTMRNQSEIPFLRTQINAMDLSKTHTAGFGLSPVRTTRK